LIRKVFSVTELSETVTPVLMERIAKYNRLLEIEEELGGEALYYWR